MSTPARLASVPVPLRRYWIDEGTLQRLLDLMFSYVAGDRAHGTETWIGWSIAWQLREADVLVSRASYHLPEDRETVPTGYDVRLSAPGLVTLAGIERIRTYLSEQGMEPAVYDGDHTWFEFTIGA